jgi:hypothetical protein
MASPAVERINPMHSIGEAEYSAIWKKLFATLLNGFWVHIFFFLFLLAAYWVGVRQRNPGLAAIFVACAAILAFGGGIARFFGLIS